MFRLVVNRDMPRLWIVLPWVVVALVVAVVLMTRSPDDLPTAADSARIGWQAAEEVADLAHDLFERANDEREARGIEPLAWDDDLAAIAADWSETMIATGEFEHSPPDFHDHPRFSTSAENILVGHRTTGGAHLAWMRSDSHREALLDARFDAVGVGIICRNDGRMWATQIFGRYATSRHRRVAADLDPEPVVRDDRGIACPTGG